MTKSSSPGGQRAAAFTTGEEPGTTTPRCAMAADDAWAARRSLRLAEISERTLVIDRRTGTTTLDLWPSGTCPAIEYTGDIDDWLTAIATGRYVGIAPESTVAQYPRPGVVLPADA